LRSNVNFSNDGGKRWFAQQTRIYTWPSHFAISRRLGELTMTRVTLIKLRATVLAGLALGVLAPLQAQDVTVTNARIVVANGTVIERGSIVVRSGRIISVAAGAPASTAGRVIDANGMTAMPGFIDAHRHTNTGPNEKEQMQAQLEAGYTTLLSAGGPAEGNVTLREHIDSGLINGPRFIPSGSLRLANHTPESARAEIRKMAAMGVKYTGEISLTPEPGPTAQEMEVLRAVVDEGKKAGVEIQVHAVSSPAMIAAVDAGVKLLVHLPNKDWTSVEDMKKVAASGAKILATIGFAAPVFGVFANDNTPRFRDGKAWPESISGGIRLGEEAGYMPVNARTAWDAGVILGYCTDTTYDPLAGLEHELKSFNMMFSMQDMVTIMGPNTASYIGMSDQLGTLEAGKLADIILLDGNPLEGYWNWLKTKVVIKGGAVVVDKR
jgi:imidazolonepropionase-like amidohydrolase